MNASTLFGNYDAIVCVVVVAVVVVVAAADNVLLLMLLLLLLIRCCCCCWCCCYCWKCVVVAADVVILLIRCCCCKPVIPVGRQNNWRVFVFIFFSVWFHVYWNSVIKHWLHQIWLNLRCTWHVQCVIHFTDCIKYIAYETTCTSDKTYQ